MSDASWRAVLGELIGSFIYIFISAGTIITLAYADIGGGVDLLIVAVAQGIMLSILLLIFGTASGGYFNPAISIALLIAGRLSAVRTVLYIVAQVLGGLLAGIVLRSIYGVEIWNPVHLGTPALATEVSFGTGILIEAILTFFLGLAVFGAAIDGRVERSIGGFAVGLTLMVSVLFGGPLTGAALNPARVLGPALAAGFYDNHPVYWIGPILGGVVAALAYRYLILPPREPS